MRTKNEHDERRSTLYRADNFEAGFTGRVVLDDYGMWVEVCGQDGTLVTGPSCESVEAGIEFLKTWGIK